jgi:hypothetical protein
MSGLQRCRFANVVSAGMGRSWRNTVPGGTKLENCDSAGVASGKSKFGCGC